MSAISTPLAPFLLSFKNWYSYFHLNMHYFIQHQQSSVSKTSSHSIPHTTWIIVSQNGNYELNVCVHNVVSARPDYCGNWGQYQLSRLVKWEEKMVSSPVTKHYFYDVIYFMQNSSLVKTSILVPQSGNSKIDNLWLHFAQSIAWYTTT